MKHDETWGHAPRHHVSLARTYMQRWVYFARWWREDVVGRTVFTDWLWKKKYRFLIAGLIVLVL